MIDANLGECLRRMRERQNISLRSLGEQTGFSASFLSQIENGQSSPSLSSMEKIASALGVTLWQFFQVAETRQANIIRTESRSQLTLEWSKADVESLGFLGDGSRFQAALVRIQPGGISGKHARPSMNDEFVFVHEGTAILALHEEGEGQLVHKGDSVTIPAGVSRQWRNEGAEDVHLVIVSVKPVL
ncbi:MAG: helix-turn-helix domain-containing protein [Bryobacteraceae bacterium]